jgi:hypothetical protein
MRERGRLLTSRIFSLFFIIRASSLKRAYPNGKYIPPEIFGDECSKWITKIVNRLDVNILIEIGSSSGEGSTSAIAKGLRGKSTWQLHLLEVDQLRHQALRKKFENEPQVIIHKYSSARISEYTSPEEVTHFYTNVQTNLNKTPINTVLKWLRDDKRSLVEAGLGDINGIEKIKGEYGISFFDFALIDGSEFTGNADLRALIGSKYILLDDINGYKCYQAYQTLLTHPDYKLEHENWITRNGFAVFSKN